MTIEDIRQLAPDTFWDWLDSTSVFPPKPLPDPDWFNWQESKVTAGAQAATAVEKKEGKWIVTGTIAGHKVSFIHAELWQALSRLGNAVTRE